MTSIPYRPSIDGMRALAVLAVLIFHLNKQLLPGGFVGVDVFFVISGFLITSIIYDEQRSGSFTVARFYQRRIARIFPVFFAVTLAILCAAAWVYTSQDFASAGALATASVLSITNMKLMLQGNYFEGSPDSQPFMHFWSLSVEEQFYIFLPPMLLIAKWLKLSRKSLLVGLGLIALASFVACQYATYKSPTWAFYLLPTRAWELLAGSILAIYKSDSQDQSLKQANIWSVIGFCLIVFSFVMVNESLPFPGSAALVPVLGCVLLIGRFDHPHTITDGMLSQPLVVQIGKLSYSLYLWHWPVYCFTDYRLYDSSLIVRVVVKIALTTIFALASYYMIERPLRGYLNRPHRVWIAFSSFLIGVVVFGIGGVTIRSRNYIDAAVSRVAKGGVEVNSQIKSPSLVLMGDSNGSMYGTMMKSLAVANNMKLNVISVAAGDPLPDTELYRRSIQFLQSNQPDVVVFAAAWSQKINDNPDRLRTALGEILQHARYVVLLLQPPILPEEASRDYFRAHGVRSVFEESEVARERKVANLAIAALESDRVKVIDVAPLFLKEDGEILFRDLARNQLFQDRTHLSGYGAERVLPKVDAAIKKLLKH